MQQEAANYSIQDFSLEGKSLEKWILEEQSRFGKWLMKKTLEEIDKKFFLVHPEEWESKMIRERTIETVTGTITYKRRIYQNKKSKEYIAPVDEYVGWEAGERISTQLKEWCAELSTKISFRDVSEVIMKLRQARVSGQAVHNRVQELGQKRKKEIDQEIKNLYEKPGESTGKKKCTIFIEVDSMYASAQRERVKNFEIYLGVIHEGWIPEVPFSNRIRLMNKKVVVEARNPAFFWDSISVELAKKYDLSSCKVVINGDGAEWIRKGVEYFPQGIFQLDKFHWLRNLRRAVGNDIKSLKQLRDLLEKENWEEVKLLVEVLKVKYPNRQEMIEGFWNYVYNHKGEIVDWRQRIEVEIELAKGLGAAESNIDTVLVNRFKRHRRHWSKAGANNLGYLVALRYNKELITWLKKEKTDEIHIKNSVLQRKNNGGFRKNIAFEWLQADVPVFDKKSTQLSLVLRGLLKADINWVA